MFAMSGFQRPKQQIVPSLLHDLDFVRAGIK